MLVGNMRPCAIHTSALCNQRVKSVVQRLQKEQSVLEQDGVVGKMTGHLQGAILD